MFTKIKEWFKEEVLESNSSYFYLKFNISLFNINFCFKVLNLIDINFELSLPIYLRHYTLVYLSEKVLPWCKKYSTNSIKRRYIEWQLDYSFNLQTGFEISLPRLQDHCLRSLNISLLGFDIILTTCHMLHLLPNRERYPTEDEVIKSQEVWEKEMIKQYKGKNWSDIIDYNNKEDYAKRKKAWDKVQKYYESLR